MGLILYLIQRKILFNTSGIPQKPSHYGLNNIERNESILDNSLYRIWSMTKPIIGFAAMQLIEKNFLSLDDTIDKHLSDFKNLKKLALTSERKILKLWEGLGYYRRSRNLMATAKIIVNKNNKSKILIAYEPVWSIGSGLILPFIFNLKVSSRKTSKSL